MVKLNNGTNDIIIIIITTVFSGWTQTTPAQKELQLFLIWLIDIKTIVLMFDYFTDMSEAETPGVC